MLIALAKIRRLGVLQDTYGEALIGPTVHEEVVTAGRTLAAPGVEQVENALANGWLKLARFTTAERRLASRILRTSRLHKGEAEALAIAERRRRRIVLDDKEARGMAQALGLDYVGTAGVLLDAFFQEHIGLGDLESAIADLAGVVWLSPKVVATVLRIAREER